MCRSRHLSTTPTIMTFIHHIPPPPSSAKWLTGSIFIAGSEGTQGYILAFLNIQVNVQTTRSREQSTTFRLHLHAANELVTGGRGDELPLYPECTIVVFCEDRTLMMSLDVPFEVQSGDRHGFFAVQVFLSYRKSWASHYHLAAWLPHTHRSWWLWTPYYFFCHNKGLGVDCLLWSLVLNEEISPDLLFR